MRFVIDILVMLWDAILGIPRIFDPATPVPDRNLSIIALFALLTIAYFCLFLAFAPIP